MTKQSFRGKYKGMRRSKRLADLRCGEMAERIAGLTDQRDELRSLLQAWERRVICGQCGQRYTDRACGPTHAVVHALVWPEHFDG